MKTSSLTFLALCGLLTAARPAALAVQTGEAPSTAADPATGIAKSKLAPPYSGNIGDVVKLAQSGVDESVVLAYVRNSPVPFNPSADEIIKLHNAGISSQVLTAMLQRGGELRQQAPPPAPYDAAPQALPAAPQQSAATYSTPAYYGTQDAAPASTAVYLNSTPAYTYPAYNYSYGYSWYYPYSYSYYYPWWGYASWCSPWWGRSGCYPSYASYYHYPRYNRNPTPARSWHNPRMPANVQAGGRAGGARFNYVRPGGFAGSGIHGGTRMGGFNGGTRVGGSPRMGGFNGGGARVTGGAGGMRVGSGARFGGSFGGGMRVAGGGGGARFGGGGHGGGGFGRR